MKRVNCPQVTHDYPWYGKLLLTAIFPGFKSGIKNCMHINQVRAQRSKEHSGTV